jgi:hypothetical protein
LHVRYALSTDPVVKWASNDCGSFLNLESILVPRRELFMFGCAFGRRIHQNPGEPDPDRSGHWKIEDYRRKSHQPF